MLRTRSLLIMCMSLGQPQCFTMTLVCLLLSVVYYFPGEKSGWFSSLLL